MTTNQKEQQQLKQQFLDFIKSYEFINKQGRLDLELFSYYLMLCFHADGIRELAPDPRRVCLLLIELIESTDLARQGYLSKWVQQQKLVDWTPLDAHMYPYGKRTYIHMGGLVFVSHYWIYCIGHEILGILEPEKSDKYYKWVKPEWTFVFTFIDGYHNFFSDYQKAFDKSTASERGYSLFEAFHLAKSTGSTFEDATKEIKKRSLVHQVTTNQITASIESGFNLEAITLQECLISNYLFNFLTAHKIKADGLSFFELISKTVDVSKANTQLFDQINKWRVKRNDAVHGFVQSTLEDFSGSHEVFLAFAKNTAQQGQSLCLAVSDWYGNESVNFFKTKFDDERTLN